MNSQLTYHSENIMFQSIKDIMEDSTLVTSAEYIFLEFLERVNNKTTATTVRDIYTRLENMGVFENATLIE